MSNYRLEHSVLLGLNWFKTLFRLVITVQLRLKPVQQAIHSNMRVLHGSVLGQILFFPVQLYVTNSIHTLCCQILCHRVVNHLPQQIVWNIEKNQEGLAEEKKYLKQKD